MAFVMQPLLVAAVPEILHSNAKPTQRDASTSGSTAASSRSASVSDSEDHARPRVRRSKTIGCTDVAELGTEYPSGVVAHNSDEAARLRRSKTSPGLEDKGLADVYPTDLIVRNTFLEFREEPVFLQLRTVKSAPSSPVAGKDVEFAPRPPAVIELASMLDVAPKLGSPEMPSSGSAQHHSGECKPCAFFWKEAGCGNGADCIYCHLCDANEKKRRQKEKKALLKAQSQTGRTPK